MDNVFSIEGKTLVKKLVIIDGFTRAGKFFLGKIVAGLKETDYFQSVSALEQILFLYRLEGISEDAAIALFREILDEHAYNIRIGRNLNTRFLDASSIYNSPEPAEYIKRTASEFGEISLSAEQIVDSFWSGKRWSVFVTHETLSNAGLLFKAYPELRMINLLRHPVDVIHSWFLRGWGRRFGTDPLAFTPVAKGPKGPVPWYAYEWKEDYEASSEADRVIKSIVTLTEMSTAAYAKLTKAQKAQIIFVRYENVIENTAAEIERMGKFLGTEACEKMPVILTREKCPGKISLEKRLKKTQELKDKASKEPFAAMMRLAAQYEANDNPYEVRR